VEAVEIDISTKSPGRLKEILADEGDFVKAGDALARMDTTQLEAQRRQAEAQLQRARIGVDTAGSLVAQREAEKTAAEAVVAQRQAELDAAQRTLARTEQLAANNTVSLQVLDNDRAAGQGRPPRSPRPRRSSPPRRRPSARQRRAWWMPRPRWTRPRPRSKASSPKSRTARCVRPATGGCSTGWRSPARCSPPVAACSTWSISATSYMTFFLPTAQAGRVAIGSEVRLVLDAAPQYVIPAKATYVADVAQFTPKTVETEEERQKLMFRIKARIAPELLSKYIRFVKTGLPGMAYVKLDPNAEWPAALQGKLVQ